MLKTIAPRLWEAGNATVEAVMQHDLRLHLPFHIPNHKPPQPTAFAEVQYRFAVTDSVPRKTGGGVSGWDAFTSLGHYDGREVALILWDDRSVVTFPPGSTFFLPAGLMSYSFTSASSDSSPMLVTQSTHHDLHDYAANGFRGNAGYLSLKGTKGEREAHCRRRAEALVGRFPTITEFDGAFSENCLGSESEK
jgi:hypothetical protein